MSQVVAEPVAADQVAGALGEVEGRTPWQIFWGRFKKDKVAITGAGFIFVLVLIAIFAPLIAHHINHHDWNEILSARGPNGEPPPVPNALNAIGLPAGPSGKLWFGADQSGRDLFTRTIYGARTSLEVAVLATGFSVIVGVALGVMAGVFG